jgi:membrane-bound transcription factor site-1 protease
MFCFIQEFRTINHPADMSEVIAVGGLSDDGEAIASYSSRGMTSAELSFGMGRMRPDLLTYSQNIVSALSPA